MAKKRRSAAKPTRTEYLELPDHVWINGYRVEIQWRVPVSTPIGKAMQCVYGTCSVPTLRIDVDPSRPVSHVRATLFHEIVHALVGLTTLLAPSFADDGEMENEEPFVASLERSMFPVLSDPRNAAVIDFICFGRASTTTKRYRDRPYMQVLPDGRCRFVGYVVGKDDPDA